MGDRHRVDEATVLWAASAVNGVDPAGLAGVVDVEVLARIVASADACGTPIDAAAAVLVGVTSGRPFPSANAAIGWLAATEVLASARCRLAARPGQVVALCERIRDEGLGEDVVAGALRRWVVEDGLPCPVCGRRVYEGDPLACSTVPRGSSQFELTARCAFEHGAHDRFGRTSPSTAHDRADARRPVVGRGDCGSLLVADDDRCLVVSPFCDDPPIVQIVEVDDVRASDLVGPWTALVERSRRVGFAPADDVDVDDGDRIDVERLRRSLCEATR